MNNMGRINEKLSRFRDMKLVYEDNSVREYYLVDSYRVKQGEYFIYWEGVFKSSGFYAHGNNIGKQVYTHLQSGLVKLDFYSIVKPGEEISEEDYRKELALYRLGEIDCPQLSLLLKDYGYEEKK